MVTLDLIDDLEDADKLIRVTNSPKRDGIWDTSNDGSVGGIQTPAPTLFKPTALGTDAPYPGDKYAAYMKGSGFVGYGAFMNVSMRLFGDYQLTPQYDASAYQGLSFWAKVGSASAANLRVRFISGDTDPRGGKCKSPTSTFTPNHDQLCFNHYSSDVTLDRTWKLYQLDFARDFAQGADGMLFSSIDLQGMYGLEFFFAPGETFELWIDDLSFVKKQ